MNKIKNIKHWYEGAYVIPFHIDHPDYCLYIFDKKWRYGNVLC